jgi:hypothetical protein
MDLAVAGPRGRPDYHTHMTPDRERRRARVAARRG